MMEKNTWESTLNDVNAELHEAQNDLPEINAPEIKMPEITAPEISAPEINVPEITAPEMQAPAMNAMGATIPEKNVPSYVVPNATSTPTPSYVVPDAFRKPAPTPRRTAPKPATAAKPENKQPAEAAPPEVMATNTGVRLACTMAAMMGLFAIFLCWAEKESRVIRRFAIQSTALTVLHAALAVTLLLIGVIFHFIPYVGLVMVLLCMLTYLAGLSLLTIVRVLLMKRAWEGVRYDLPMGADRYLQRFYGEE